MNKRIEYIDIYRSIGIILMVMGHVRFGKTFDHFVHAFHMPMFFFISGFLFNHKAKDTLSFKTFITKKTKSLLIPYLCFGVISYIVFIIFNGFTIKPLYNLFFENTDGLPITSALWFLTALFWVDVIYFLVDRYFKSIYVWGFVIVISLLGNINQLYLPFILPYSLGCSFVGLGLFHIGYVLKINSNKKFIFALFNLNWISLIILTIIDTILIFKNGYINVRSEKYAFIPLFWINAVCFSILILNYSKKFYNKFGKTKFADYLCGIGYNSIVYVCLNQLVILFVSKIITIHLNYFVVGSLRCILVLIILYIFEQLITKTKLKVLIGKF